MIGLGGAEFRPPLLIGFFGFAALHAVIVNKALSLVVVAYAVPAAHLSTVPRVLAGIVSGLATGSVIGTSFGGLLLGVVSAAVLIPLLVILLVVSSVKLWRHRQA